jgi:PAS domain S-box-containing protein
MTNTPVGTLDPTAEHYRQLVEWIHDVITVVDAEGTVLYQSPSSEHVKGWPSSALVGENMLEYIHPDDRDRVARGMREVVDQPGHLTGRIEYRFRTPDDEWLWLASTATNPGPDSPIDGYVVTSRDITDRKQLEDQLRRQRDRLDAFSTVVSHDLQGPLNVVAGSLDLAEQTGEREHFDRARRGLERIERLVDNLLALAQEGELVGDTEPVSLAAAAERAWKNVPTADATLSLETSTAVRADPVRLGQLLENLFRNAIAHVGPNVRVVVGDLRGDGFFVADDGPGVPDSKRQDVFEPGVSTAEGGTGLGLAIVQEIVEGHGWAVDVTDADEGGARFEFTGVTLATEEDIATDPGSE